MNKNLVHSLGVFALAVISYFVLARIGLYFATINQNISPIWPASGVGIALAIRFGWKVLPGIFLGSFVSDLYSGLPVATALGIGIGNTLEVLVGRWLYGQVAWRKSPLSNQSEPVALITLALFATMVSATVGVTTFSLFDSLDGKSRIELWLTWWAGDALGALIVAPLALAILDRSLWPPVNFKKQAFGLTLLALNIACAAFIFGHPSGSHWLFLIFPSLLLISLFQSSALCLRFATFAIAITAIALTLLESKISGGATLNASLLNIQFLLAGVGITALMFEGFKKAGILQSISITLVGGWLIAGILFFTYNLLEERNSEARFQDLIHDAEYQITNKMKFYEEMLLSGVSLYRSSDEVDNKEWEAFVRNQNVIERYPGVLGLGVVWPVKPAEVNRFIKSVKKTYPDFQIKKVPTGEAYEYKNPTDEYYIISLIKPLDKNQKALGLDIGSERLRRKAAELARDIGKPVLSADIHLVQDNVPKHGNLLLYPIYEKGTEPSTVQERRKHFKGWIYAPLYVHHLFEEAAQNFSPELDLYVFDGNSATQDALCFSSNSSTDISNLDVIKQIELAQLNFTLGWRRSKGFVTYRHAEMAVLGFSGALITLLLAGFIGNLQTVNLRASKLAEEQTRALNEIREQYELAVNGSHDGIWDWKLSSGEMYFSSRWKEIFGYKDHELKNDYSTIEKLIHPEDRARGESRIRSYFIREKKTFDFEGRFLHKDGHYLWCLVRGEALFDHNNKPFRMAGSLTDITLRKNVLIQMNAAREAAEAATKAKSEFLANMSHEIRTPLTGLLGTTNLLRRTELNATQLDYLEIIRQSADSLLVMLNDVLDFSKIEANKMQLEVIEFDLNKTFSEIANMMRFNAAQKGVDFRTEFPSNIDRNVIGDPARLRQILLNLLSNAIKFTSHGEVHFEIRLLEEFKDRLRLRIQVRDTGIGISEESQKQIFDIFSQADSSTTRKFGGSGLGLSICSRLVSLMNSELKVESKLNQGSRFWFDIELDLGRPVERQVKSSRADERTVSAGARVLVAEDNLVNQRVLVSLLENAGYKTYTALNGKEALEFMKQGLVDLALMDCQMPDMDGYEAAREWRRISNFADAVPIIALTANATKGDREKALAAGMDDYLPKPVRIEALIDRIEFWLSKGVRIPQALVKLKDPERLGSSELVKNVSGIYLSQASTQIQQIRDFIQQENLVAMKKVAHSLKSASATLGFNELASSCLKLETWTSEMGSQKDLHNLADGLIGQFENAKGILSELSS